MLGSKLLTNFLSLVSSGVTKCASWVCWFVLFEVLGNTFTPSVSLLCSVTSLSILHYLPWKTSLKICLNYSLFDREHASFVLSKIHKSGEHIIAAKFLNSCYLIVEAVVRTFQQRWRSMNGYKIRNLGDHRVLFVFDNSSDVERIIKNQPWSFDKHLVVLQTFEEFSKLKRSSFW